MPQPDWNKIGENVCAATRTRARLQPGHCVIGGDINRAFEALHGDRRLFVKLNSARHAGMFGAEHDALRTLRDSTTVRVPDPVCHGSDRHHSWLVMEFLDLHAVGDATALGRGLAAMHRVTADQFGWRGDNTIGTTPQHNRWSGDWVEFWATQRLGYQLQLACDHGFAAQLETRGGELLATLSLLFATYSPEPALLHGDLWSGNHAYLTSGEPVIFDPASYYGDRETDLAMTELFGGFDADFYAAYRSQFPLDDGYRVRRTLYQLYHVLNHLNLFGRGYLARSVQMLDELLSELH